MIRGLTRENIAKALHFEVVARGTAGYASLPLFFPPLYTKKRPVMDYIREHIAILLASLIAIFPATSGTPEEPFWVTVRDSGLEFRVSAKSERVEDLLEKEHIPLAPTDIVFPDRATILAPGTRLTILRAKELILNDGGAIFPVSTQARFVSDFLIEQNIVLGEKDYVSPDAASQVLPDMKIVITRIIEKEVVRVVSVAPPEAYEENGELSYGKTRLIYEGAAGEKEETVLVTFKNGVTIRERVLASRVLKEPLPRHFERGTKIVIGRVQEGKASWYQYRGGFFAASTVLARGTFARVTRTDTGSSIVVQINDYGPLVPGRVIDLDAVAFKKLGPLEKGVIPVKVEEIL